MTSTNTHSESHDQTMCDESEIDDMNSSDALASLFPLELDYLNTLLVQYLKNISIK